MALTVVPQDYSDLTCLNMSSLTMTLTYHSSGLRRALTYHSSPQAHPALGRSATFLATTLIYCILVQNGLSHNLPPHDDPHDGMTCHAPHGKPNRVGSRSDLLHV